MKEIGGERMRERQGGAAVAPGATRRGRAGRNWSASGGADTSDAPEQRSARAEERREKVVIVKWRWRYWRNVMVVDEIGKWME